MPRGIKQERRRRNTDALSGKRRKLSVNEENLDRTNFVYRFANDEGSRIHDLTVNDDWEVVSQRQGDMTDGMGSEISRIAGTNERGSPFKSVLLRKKKDWHEDDQRSKQRRIDDTEASIKGGTPQGAADDGKSYVPQSGIQFEVGSRS